MKKERLSITLIFFILLVLCFLGCTKKSVALEEETWNSQTISTSTTKKISGTVILNGTITVNKNVTLTIEFSIVT